MPITVTPMSEHPDKNRVWVGVRVKGFDDFPSAYYVNGRYFWEKIDGDEVGPDAEGWYPLPETEP